MLCALHPNKLYQRARLEEQATQKKLEEQKTRSKDQVKRKCKSQVVEREERLSRVVTSIRSHSIGQTTSAFSIPIAASDKERAQQLKVLPWKHFSCGTIIRNANNRCQIASPPYLKIWHYIGVVTGLFYSIV